jgi:hypothetical protein
MPSDATNRIGARKGYRDHVKVRQGAEHAACNQGGTAMARRRN